MKSFAAALFPMVLLLLPGCFDRRLAPVESDESAEAEEASHGPFQLKPEWNGPCRRSDKVDVNLGNAPEVFVRAAHCQAVGTEPSKDVVSQWAGRLKTKDRVRRLDAVIAFCKQADRKCQLTYSDPWLVSPDVLGPPPVKKVKRDLGAVFMFFFSCPRDTNCQMDWANTHAPGMDDKSPLLAFGDVKEDYYSPLRAGFWRRELMDAKYAGLDFLLPNTYGPDIEDGKLGPLQDALDSLEDPVKIGFFDDTWTWGQPYFSEFWKTKPDLNDPEKAAALIYEHKWKAFFSQIDKKHWYRFKGKPFIYFYNAGSLNPRSKTGPVIKLLKEKFKADFGEEPFVDADGAYFDDPSMNEIADAKYMWFTFNAPEKRSRSTMKGHIVDHAMVKWDATGRDHAGEPTKPSDLIVKDDRFLRKVLMESEDAEVLVIATWNDLGEGTGFNRAYDYYFRGQWQRPDYFMRVTRKAQSGELK
ncbi:MAG: VgrG protein [Polyangiaceae bacterium]|jgi:hypothetical protein|nr:VgrG protein [Polyangiaceae bacterium]